MTNLGNHLTLLNYIETHDLTYNALGYIFATLEILSDNGKEYNLMVKQCAEKEIGLKATILFLIRHGNFDRSFYEDDFLVPNIIDNLLKWVKKRKQRSCRCEAKKSLH